MDLSFTRFDRDPAGFALPTDLAVLMVGVVARQAASPTALAQSRLVAARVAVDRLRPADGAFHRATAASLTRWKGE